jgi:hypothetical protein
MSQNRVIVIVENPKDHGEHLQHARNMKNALDGGSTGINTNDLGNAIDDVQKKMTARSSRAPGTAKKLKTSLFKLTIEQDAVRGQMQTYVDNMGGSLEAKMAAALRNGFHVQRVGSRNKQDFKVTDGKVSCSAKLTAKAIPTKRSFHEWADSIDKGITWRYIEPTVKASRTCSGYERGQFVMFRHRAFTTKGPGEWHYDEIIIR